MNREEIESASLEAVLRSYTDSPEAVSRASLALVLQRMREAKAASLALLSTWAHGRARQANIKAHDRLVHSLKSARLAFHRLDGLWVFENSPACSEKRRQPFLCVFGIEQSEAAKLSSRWCAAAPFLWLGPGIGGDVVLISPTDGSVSQVGRFTHEPTVAALTAMCRKQTLIGFEFRPATWMGRVAEAVVVRKNHQLR